VPTNGIHLHVLDAGPSDAPPVILLHGFPEFSYGWRKQIDPLAAAGFRVIVPDQRGYNRSDKPQQVSAYTIDTLAADVLGLADACGARTVRVVGHDWGAAVGWWLALHHPERIERLAILNVPHPVAFARTLRRNPRQILRSWYIVALQVPWLPERVLQANGMRAMTRALQTSSRPHTFGSEDLERYRDAWSQPGALTGMVNWYRAALRHGLRLRAPARVRVPTLILWGDRDAFLEPGNADRSLALCDDGRLVRFPQATHWLQHEEAAEVNRQLIEFLQPA
jgi:epoxide hydrolase 4